MCCNPGNIVDKVLAWCNIAILLKGILIYAIEASVVKTHTEVILLFELVLNVKRFEEAVKVFLFGRNDWRSSSLFLL